MLHKPTLRTLALTLLAAALALTGCAPLLQPVKVRGSAPTPMISFQKGGVENPSVFTDPAKFQGAVLQALAGRDTEKLEQWMTDPFLTGAWRGALTDAAPADALNRLYADQLSSGNSLELVQDANLTDLLGGKDPLGIPGDAAGVVDAFLINGWGSSGRDEAILFVARQADNSLKLRGWMQVPGGFSGARLGGMHIYQNDTLGFRVLLPPNTQVSAPTASYVAMTAPQGPGGHPGGAYLTVEPAGGRTAEQVIEKVKADLGPGFNVAVESTITIDDTPALIVKGLPGQDSNIQLFMVRDDMLYNIVFAPDDPHSPEPYRQMEDIYGMVLNTFHFIK